jgi:uncharacterized Tic20 family protein
MNELLPKKICRLAGYLHLAGLMWIPIGMMITVLIFASMNQGYLLFFLGLFVIPIIGMSLTSLLIFLIWRTNRSAHSFIDLAGRSIINFMLSTCLCVVILFTIAGMSCGLSTISQNWVVSIWLLTSWLILPLLLLGHFCLAIIGAIHAWKGRVYSYPLTIKFLTETL